MEETELGIQGDPGSWRSQGTQPEKRNPDKERALEMCKVPVSMHSCGNHQV